MDTTLKERIKEQLSSIREYYLTKYKDDLSPDSQGLMTGLAGIILLQSLFFEIYNDPRFKKELTGNIELLITNIENDQTCPKTFCDGLAGIGWLFIYLNERKIIDIDINDFLEEMDEVLEIEFEEIKKESNYDILHGYLGIGLYFLKRKKYSIVETIIDSLESSCDKIQDEIAWKRFDAYHAKQYIYDFGLAHGNAGIIYFLGKCYQQNILPAICRNLISGCINFYLANIQSFEKNRSFFPSIKPVDTYKIANDPAYSRLAWCYGDLGILHTFLFVSHLLNDYPLIRQISPLFEKVAARKETSETSVFDNCFCHGSSGVGYMYLDIYKTYKQNSYRETAEFWLEKTLQLTNIDRRIYNDSGIEVKQTDIIPDLLNGLGGAAVFYLAFLNARSEDTWNELFFLT